MSNDLIYDVGMNTGDDTAFYLHLGYRVVAIEANPELTAIARERFQPEIASGRLIIHNVGIAEREGDFPFWVCERHSEWSSLDRDLAARDDSAYHEITVPCVRFGAILRECGAPFYLKIDIEGRDHLCLEDMAADIAPEYISVEASDISLLDLLRGLGYDRFKCISQFYFLPLELPPAPAQLAFEEKLRAGQSLAEFRTFDGWQFPSGSSGVFGRDLRGRWQNFDEMKATFAHFRKLQRAGIATPFWNDRGYSFWSDFHATKETTLAKA
jgi:FkbM family methyltransferase